MSQTSINPAGQAIGVVGQLIDDGPSDVVSAFSEETVNEIPFGCGLVQGVADDGVKLPAANTDKPVGINIFGFWHQTAGAVDPTGAQTGDIGATGLKPKAGVDKGRKGRALVPVEAGIVIVPGTDRPFLRWQSDGGVNTQVGMWSNVQDGGTRLIDCTRLGVFTSSVSTVDNPTGGSSLAAILEFDFTSRNS